MTKEVNENGQIKKTCMRFQCGQPIWVREYQKFNEDRPLFCPVCWEQFYSSMELYKTQLLKKLIKGE